MRRWIVTLLLGAVMFFPTLALAQAPLSLDKVEVDLWPEYDKPTMLVIYHIFLPSGTALPTTMNLRIPQAAGAPTNLAFRSQDGQLYNLDYSQAPAGDWSTVTFNTPATEIQLEYYDPGLNKNGSAHSFTYTWPGDYAVKTFAVQVQQPVGASALQVTPALGQGQPGESGLIYYNGSLGSVAASSQATVQLSYQKSSSDLSVQSLDVGPSAPINASTPGRQTVTDVLPWALGGLGILLIGFGGWWYWQTGRDRQTLQPRRRHLSRSAPAVEAVTSGGEAGIIYCHRCGKRADPEDVFCRSCGSRLRKEE